MRGRAHKKAEPHARRFAYQPALDGVRGVAVAMVFHGGWISGGYVGVSVFFTLSGYLITSLALIEHRRTGSLDVPAFYGRRVRRLLPASLACLAGVTVLAAFGLVRDVEHLRRDLWGALAQVYNWVALSGGQSYADLVAGDAGQSPLDHYWSLAIEEQFYWVWPIVLVGVLRCRPATRLALVAALAMLAAVAAPVIAAVWGPNAAYWSTPARFAEILVGALLAVVLHGRARRRPLHPRTWWLSLAGLAVIVAAALAWPAGSGPAYTGWLPLFAVASAALLLGLQVASPLRRALAWEPLVLLGAISYGVYLYHWPIFAVLDEQRTGLARPALLVVRLAVTLAVAVASFELLERPVRERRMGWRPTATAAVAVCVTVAMLVAVVPVGDQPYWVGSSSDRRAAALEPVDSVAPLRVATSVPATTTSVPETTSTVATPSMPAGLSRPVRIIVLGDSTASATGEGLVSWAADHPDLAKVGLAVAPGCGIIRGGVIPTDQDDSFRRACAELLDERLPAELAEGQPDVVVGMVSMRDLEDRVWDDAEGPLSPLDDRFIERLGADYTAMTGWLLDAGVAKVVWVVPPIPTPFVTGPAATVLDPARFARYRAALESVVAQFPGRAGAVDLAGWLQSQPMPERPDGLHWSPAGARDLADRFLAAAVIAAAVS